MRRTMHAAAILLACASQIQAQTPSDRKSDENARSVATKSDSEMASAEMTAVPIHPATSNQYSDPNCLSGDAGRPYSQLSQWMQCNDWRPNLWNNYASERAAVVAQVSKHVDMQCKCFECQGKLHATACGPECDGTSSCKVGSTKILRNRYKEPMSTLFTNASDSCGAPCVAPRGASACESQSSCTARPSESQIMPAATVLKSEIPGVAITPKDRFVTPVINAPKAAAVPQPRSLFEGRR